MSRRKKEEKEVERRKKMQNGTSRKMVGRGKKKGKVDARRGEKKTWRRRCKNGRQPRAGEGDGDGKGEAGIEDPEEQKQKGEGQRGG